MSVFLQLRMLLWKNYTIRRRNWGRVLVEIVWPLFLFIILMLVRTRNLKKYHHECTFEEKAMPSTGVLEFTRSFICTFNNTCHRTTWTEPRGLEKYNETYLNQLLDDIEETLLFTFDTEEKSQALVNVFKDLGTLKKVLDRIKAGNAQPPLDGFELGKVVSLFNNPEAFLQELEGFMEIRNITLTPDNVIALADANIKPELIDEEHFNQILQNPKLTLCNITLTKKFILNIASSDLEEILDSLCSLSVTDTVTAVNIIADNINKTVLQEEMNKFIELNGGGELSFEDWNILMKVSTVLVTELAKYESTQAFVSDLKDVLNELTSLIKDISSFQAPTLGEEGDKSSNSTDLSFVSGLSRLVCGRNLSLATFSSGGATTQFDELRDRIQKKDEESKYKFDNSTTQMCNDMIKTLEGSQGIQFLWSQVKPFIRGKILYTPDTPVTRRLVEVVNRTFQPLETIKLYLKNWTVSYSLVLQDFLLDPNNQESIKNFFTSPEGPFQYALQLGEEKNLTLNQTDIKNTLEKYFNGNFSDTWNTTLIKLDEFIENVSNYLECFQTEKFEAVSSEHELEKRGLELIATNQLWAGLVFPDITKDLMKLPRFVSYKIRIDADKVDSTKRIEDRLTMRGPRRRPGIDLKYLYFGFSYLQDLVERAIIHIHTGRNISSLPGIFMQQEPYPCYIQDRFILAIARTFPLFMTLAWVYSASMIIKSIVHEKELRLKETMRVMGLGNLVHWVAWFIDSFSVMFLSCILLTIILVYGNILENSAPTLVFCFMLCYTVSTIMLSFLLSTLFSRANVAAAAGGIIFFILYLPYSFMVVWEETLQSTTKILSCLISNIGFGFGCAYFSHYEESGIGAQWENVWVSPLLGDSFSLAGCMGMLLIDSALYGILTWYIEAVFPGEFGVPKPFYFFLTLSYWTGRSRRILQYDSEPDIRMGEKPKHTESEPTHLKLGVSIKHLHKVYNNGKIAVEDLNLNFYEGQITSFLGHNGAGKTTTISILTGLFPPSAGTALINGLDITRDMDEIRNSMGTCPQHNVLFQQLTVEEHLWFFARIKNQPKEGLNDQITQMINDLGIPHKRHAMSKDLSGGMQRKLSIACAFVGGSKVVVLDEPTAGVDPYSRRAIWDLLIKYKANRTIILTTHFMDEADLLGDRIAIINCGKLVCCGSSLFLKSLYGVGYYLTLVKTGATENTGKDQFIDIMKVRTAGSSANTSRDDDDGIEDIDDDEGISDVSTKDTIINPSSGNSKYPTYPLTKFIQRFVPNAALVEEIGQEIVFVLPVEETKEISMKQFELLFNELDLFMKKMNISSYGLSDTTLEEIFLKVASNENDGEIVRGNTSAIANKLRRRSLLSSSVVKNIGTAFTPERTESGSRKVKVVPGESTAYSEVQVGDSESHVLTSHKNPSDLQIVKTGKPLVLKHIMALEIKRFHHSKRNKKGFMCEILLPAAFVCLAMGFTMILPPLVEEPEMEMSPWLYPGKGGPNYIYYSNSLPGYPTDWPNRYTDALLSSDSAGTKCVGPNKNKCDSSTLQYKNLLLKYSSNTTIDDSKNPPCTCSIGTQICPEGATGPSPPSIKIPTGDMLINMTSRNISQWSIKTEDQFVKQRYGGFEFGVKNPMILKNMTLMREVFERIVAATNQGRNVFSGFVEATAVDALFGYIDTLLDPNMFDNIRIWFNNKGWAASVAYMNAANNIVLRATVKQTEEDDVDAFLNDFDSSTDNKYDTSQYGIRLISHPMNYTETQLDKELIRQVGISLLHAICVIFAMSFVPASFVVFHIEERISKIKHLHFVSGVNPSTYWVSALLWDLIMYTASASLCVIIFLIFDADAYVSEDNLGPLVLLLLLYGFASVPLMYPASFVFSVPSSAFVTLACANLFIGIITTITTFVLENFDDVELKNIGNICKKVFLIFPHYCLGRGLMDMATEQSINSVIAKFGLISVRSRFEFDFLGKYFLWMFVQGIVFFLATLAIQSEFWTWRLKKDETDKKAPEEIEDLDEDVEKERSRILNSQGGSDVLQTKNLFKRYNKNIRQAVDNLTFGVSKGECFGLLGVNGAGKTTTFKMLTGDTDVTAGEAFVGGYSILRDMDKVRSSLGYCPQFDALDSLLTGREHLTLYARLRGLDEASVKRVTEWGLKKLGLAAYSDRCAGTYSGGNKRKLSTAIALVGNPSIVFLDEPTSGMDPGARRFLWNSILEMIKGGQSVVLTSHSMEECEALCSRLGIMVNGQFKCLGSIQHLKNRFGSGYTLTVRCEEGKGEEMSARMSVLLPLAELKEEHYNQLQFQLPVIGTKLPAVFRHMEDLRAEGFLEDYSLTQTTLDEVFVRFAKEQTDLQEDEIKPKNLKQKILDTMTNKKN